MNKQLFDVKMSVLLPFWSTFSQISLITDLQKSRRAKSRAIIFGHYSKITKMQRGNLDDKSQFNAIYDFGALFPILALAGDLIIKSTGESSPLLVMWVIATPGYAFLRGSFYWTARHDEMI
jgi:hypothetical protein